MPKKADLKIVKPEPVEKALPCGEEWNGLDWEDWYDDDRLAREWEERMNGIQEESRPRVHRSIIEEDLPHEFTMDELRELTDRMVKADKDREDAERRLESLGLVQKEIKGEIAKHDKAIREARWDIERGEEIRPTQVEKTIDYDAGYVTFFRLDTGEEVRTRPIRDDERQMPLVA